ncbi:Positive regulator of CheA protein activity (CheW) [Paramagnetospirillum magnetotacticum MS-1]|uniref:Positive regulator of CheA protein activity (CheW) n=1 Tax=Paramagnetospirillum magnetotacticum MS-1 TaxID=272627 RepID=A0A0C2Z070_PARME|nr:chemotaxis protein CheW [Paramagnetospirillum magnetotacticum]KIM00306.1 Positive regulator of CheA protein activity (CheW) [Paramagnetospirillum magnetotacticum MS-1]
MSVADLSLDQILEARRGETRAIVNVDEPQLKLVVFTLDGDWFAFAGDKVREVLPNSPVFYLPGCPQSLEGVINVRGDIDSVVNLRAVLGYGPMASLDHSRILLCQGGGMRSGVRVDGVEEVMDIAQSRIMAPPHTIPEHRKPIVLGIIEFAGHLVTLLDVERIFADYRGNLE